MNRYEIYNPEIDSVDDSVSIESLTYGDDPSLDKSGDKVGSNKKRKPKKGGRRPSPSGKRGGTDHESEVSVIDRIRQWVESPRTRILVGIAAGLLAVYLLVAFISFLSSGFHDQSEVRSVASGAAKQIANSAGEAGARLSNLLIDGTFGLGAIVIVIWLVGIAMKQFGILKFKIVNFTIKCIVSTITLSLIIGLITVAADSTFCWGGVHGLEVNRLIIHHLGWIGAALLCVLMVAVFVVICLNDIYRYFMRLKHKRDEIRRARLEEQRKEEERQAQIDAMHIIEEDTAEQSEEPTEDADHNTDEVVFSEDDEPEHTLDLVDPSDRSEDAPTLQTVEEGPNAENGSEDSKMEVATDLGTMTVTVNEIKASVDADEHPEIYDPTAELSKYKFPPYSLLKEAPTRISIDQDEQLENQNKIRKTLLDFGIPIVSIQATVGPTVTLYEIVPEKGVKISKIRSLVDDIALSLAAIGVRIIAPIPGKGTVGIEVANKDPQTVSMRSIITSSKFQNTHYELPMAIGSTINNQVYIADLAKMPHLLVAGATGQGKSVGLNAIIASLLYSKHPAELKFVLVDPKMVEFSLYARLERHYLAKLPGEEEPIITNPDKVVATLSSLCVEMDERYNLLKMAQVRNIKEYNAKYTRKVLNPNKGHRFMPYIVVIVDEFSDLIMTAGKEVEMPIARLAQKARAVGIHVIIATQRPSTNVITGIIKANFPARIAFKVSSGIDSKTILDTTGAQQLIGKGDMLVSANSVTERVQCAFIDTPEVNEICDHIAKQQCFPSAYMLPEPIATGDSDVAAGGNEGFGERDELFEEVARLIVNTNKASTSSLQRRYNIGYNRAGRIMDQLETAGIVGPAQGGKPRAVLVDPITLESILASL